LGQRTGSLIPDGVALVQSRQTSRAVRTDAVWNNNRSSRSAAGADPCNYLRSRILSGPEAGSARQADRLASYASANGWPIVSVVEEVGSGLNGRRKKLVKLLADPSVGMILVEHRDRLARFGVEYIEAALVSQGRSIIVADETEEMADIWQDFIDVVTSMCARIYGKRGARNRAKKAVAAVKDHEG